MIDLPYGKGHLSVRLPAKARPAIIRKTPLPKIQDGRAAVRQALDHPVQARPFKVLAQGRRSACILICDITRPVPNHLFLRPMIEDLLAAGIPAQEICVLIATGLHRPNVGAELAELVGDPWVLSTVRVENHNARDDAGHVDLGSTRTRGTPVKINRRFIEADLKIATGLVEPHFMAGYSGGRKLVAPGIAHADTIRTFHSARFMADPFASSCNLNGNPLHEEQLEIVRMIGEIHGLNTVIDEERDLVHVTFGEIVASHLAAVAVVRSVTEIDVHRRFHTIVTSSAGHPLDKTYYQTIKGMVTPLDILVPGGTLIIASECSEGFGSPEFREAQSRLVDLGRDAFLRTLLCKPLADIDEWQTQMQLKPMRAARIQLYTSGLSAEERRLAGVEVIESIDEAIEESIGRCGEADVAVIPEGPYVIPFYAMGPDAGGDAD
ncbi:MAG: nickel-dependent lactate racemase [Terrimicrobiaceae bacterium]|nr:nickel-dependent lactate racemase [Terrimicrobiaceae bacterium]